MNKIVGYRIGICDDGINMCSSIEEMVLSYAKQKNIRVDVEIWYSGEKLREYLEQGGFLDILFLDIELLELSGIQVAHFIREQLENRQMQIIFISAKSSYALSLFKTQPMDFLVKPIFQSNIDEVLDKAIIILDKKNANFKYQYGKDFNSITYGDIIYFTSKGRKVILITVRGKKEFYGKLKDILETLPEEFISIHQSFIINKNHVKRYNYEFVEMFNGEILTISRVHRKQVRLNLLEEGR